GTPPLVAIFAQTISVPSRMSQLDVNAAQTWPSRYTALSMRTATGSSWTVVPACGAGLATWNPVYQPWMLSPTIVGAEGAPAISSPRYWLMNGASVLTRFTT